MESAQREISAPDPIAPESYGRPHSIRNDINTREVEPTRGIPCRELHRKRAYDDIEL